MAWRWEPLSVLRRVLGGVDALAGPLVMLLQRFKRTGLVLLYHRVSPEPDPAYPPLHPYQFEAHCRLVKRYFHVIPLHELVQRHQRGESVASCCALTFDDGYRDFMEYAYPVLRRYSLPAAHFLVVDCLLTGRPTWNLRLNRILWERHRRRGFGEAIGAPPRAVVMKTALGSMPAAERYAWLEREEQDLRLPIREPPVLRPEDLGKFDSQLVEWGSHTVSHAMLAHLPGQAVQSELADSRRLLADICGTAVRYLSYPNNSYSPDVVRAAAACGYACALAVGQRQVSLRSPLLALPRLDMNVPAAMLRLEIGGLLEPIRQIRTRFQVEG